MKRPTVSVIMPNYNHGRYLPVSLGSLLAQTRPPDEIIVADDASTDDSLRVLDGLAAGNPALRVLRGEKNVGAVAAAERALAAATGDYVLGASADDSWVPELLEHSLAMLEKHPEAAFCCSDCRTVFADTGKTVLSRRRLAAGYISPEELTGVMRRKIVYLSAFGSIFKRSALLETGLLPDLRWASDRVYSLVLGLRHGFCYLPEALSVQLLRKESYGNSGLMNKTENDAMILKTLELLKTPEYADVLPRFRRSAALAALELPLLLVLLREKAHRDFLNFDLVKRVLVGELWRGAGNRTPEALKKAYWKLLGRA